MKLFIKAVLIGASIEGASAAAAATGGFGPCGPSNLLGFIGMLGHLFPGFLVASMLVPARTPEGVAIAIIILVQGLSWSLLAFGGLPLLKQRWRITP